MTKKLKKITKKKPKPREEQKQMIQESNLSWMNEKRKVRTPTRHVDDPEFQKLVERVYEMIRDGISPREILTTLTIEDETLNSYKFNQLIDLALQYAELTLHKDREYVFQLHINRYESMYNKSIQMIDFYGNPLDRIKDWQLMRGKYGNALKALKCKEDLLGLHDKSIVLEFNEHKAVVVEKEQTIGKIPDFNPDNLNIEEKKELLDLLREIRTVPIEGIQRVIVKKTTIEISKGNIERKVAEQKIDNVETHDIEFEEMPTNVVSNFQQIPDKMSEEEQDTGSIKVEDLTLKEKEVKSGKDVVDLMNMNIMEELRKRREELKKKKI